MRDRQEEDGATSSRYSTRQARDPPGAYGVLELGSLRRVPASVPLALGIARFHLKEYSEALPLLREFISRSPNVSQGHIVLAACLAQLGRLDEARAEAAEVLRIDRNYTVNGTQRRMSVFKRPEDAKHLFDALRRAGLPER